MTESLRRWPETTKEDQPDPKTLAQYHKTVTECLRTLYRMAAQGIKLREQISQSLRMSGSSTDQALAAIETLEEICDETDEAMLLAQTHLRTLAEVRITKELRVKLFRFLRKRNWGILAESGNMTVPYWNSAKRSLSGGTMFLGRRENGLDIREGHFTFLPPLARGWKLDRRIAVQPRSARSEGIKRES